MSETSTTRRIRSALRRLVGTRPQPTQRLAPARTTQPIGSTRGLGTQNNPPGQAGIASPVDEPDASTRTYHPVAEMTSTDGLIVVEVQSLATIDMQDATGQAVSLQFDDPDA